MGSILLILVCNTVLSSPNHDTEPDFLLGLYRFSGLSYSSAPHTRRLDSHHNMAHRRTAFAE